MANHGLFKGVSLAYLILILHVLLIAAVGLLVIFFRGVVNYMLWIFLGFILMILVSGYLFYRRMKHRGRQLQDTLKTPAFDGRAVEISLLGGLASFRIGESKSPPALTLEGTESIPQLEDAESMRLRKLSELAKLYENGLISDEEFNTIKNRIMDG